MKTLWANMSPGTLANFGSPKEKARFEVFDWQHRVWVRAPARLVHELERMSPAQLQAYLDNSRYGLRRATAPLTPPLAPQEDELRAKLKKQLRVGSITLGGRTYKLAPTGTGSIAVTSAAGVRRYTFDALVDVLREGRF